MTFEEIVEFYRSLGQSRTVSRRSELTDEELMRRSLSCLCGNCLCGHGPPRRCPCGEWHAAREWESCATCGRAQWCEL